MTSAEQSRADQGMGLAARVVVEHGAADTRFSGGRGQGVLWDDTLLDYFTM